MPSPSYDIDFTVPFRHRLRFTQDVLGDDADTLLDVLEPTDARVRVMFVLDAGIARNVPSVPKRLEALVKRYPQRLEQAGPVRLVAGGEACKNDPQVIDDLLAAFNEADLDRRNYLIVVGGGAVLDAVGYAAAVAHRGIRLVRLPTTTLAQDDSGIGVKNAINFFAKKNWRGTFAVPWAVINDEAILAHLPDRDYRCGFSEAVKVALLKEAPFFDRLCRDASRIADRDPDASRYAIERSAYWHLMHITRGGDPFEALEARPLDFGHWSAHKLEAMTDFEIRHGEAVGIGLAIDCHYSTLVHGLGEGDADRVIKCMSDMQIPLTHPMLCEVDQLLDGLEEFRQHLGGRLTITMIRAPGEPIDVHEVDPIAMREAIEMTLERAGAGAVEQEAAE